jgi:lipopolysaccharide export system permease protein
MKILHRYILRQLWRNFVLALGAFVFLFLLFDFFDRIDNILVEKAAVSTVLLYFLYKIPMMTLHMLPVAMLISTLFTYGLLSKNSELTAMRASGAAIWWLARPLFLLSAIVTMVSFCIGEFVVPVSEQRQKELYNIDIKQKDKRGGYTQSNFWFRDGQKFYSAGIFDSRSNAILDFTQFDISPRWEALRRVDSSEVRWIDAVIGWSMRGITTYRFQGSRVDVSNEKSLPLPISAQPRDFYEFRSDAETMNYSQLKDFITSQARNGVATSQYYADLHAKLAHPFIILITSLLVLPFALRPARTGSLAAGFMAAFVIAFVYYAVDSFSVALGRAEIVPPILGAWMANLLLGLAAVVLSLGAEAPQ